MNHCSVVPTRVPKVARRRGALLAALTCLYLVACVPLVETQDGRRMRATSPAFKDYAERVFRDQNSLSWALLEALDTVNDPEVRRTLSRIENQLRQDCDPVNRLASAHRRGKSSNRAEQLALVRALPQCEARTQEARQLLNRLEED